MCNGGGELRKEFRILDSRFKFLSAKPSRISERYKDGVLFLTVTAPTVVKM